MKKRFACAIGCLLSLHGFSQFSISIIMPLGVGSTAFGDTLLNPSHILKREGIRKVTAVETSSQGRKGVSFTSIYHLTNGQIQSRWWCYRPSPDTAFRFCNPDTLVYNNKGQLQEYRAIDGKGIIYLKVIIEYALKPERLITWITYDPKKEERDTSSYRFFYNDKEQLIRQVAHSKEGNPINAELFYNANGLLDSIRHENPAWGTYVFNRKQKGKKSHITLETQNLTYRWTYNSKGQCLSLSWTYKKPLNYSSRSWNPLRSDISYSYNENGTLAKVVEKHRDFTTIIVYSYEK